jgi:alkanesulfonate monooxygenase SsuD/methylene tetrahydromethanopterin reductase-like flavin-dependent oxidoreductase (luciferase family)
MAVVPLSAGRARAMVKPLSPSTWRHGHLPPRFCRYGFEENANLVRDLYNAGDRKQAAAAVSDELVDAIAICGTPEHCREQLGEWRRHGVGLALMNLPTGAPFEMAEMLLRSMAPAR